MNTEMDFEAVKEQFDRDGYVILPNFASETELAAMTAAIDDHYRPILAGEKPNTEDKGGVFTPYATKVIVWDPISQNNPEFINFRNRQTFQDVTAACIGEAFKSDGCLVMLSAPGGIGQAWHQDCPITEPGHYNLNRLIYIEDVTLDNGSIVVVPGSHRFGVIPEGGAQESIEGEVALTPKSGTLVLLSGHVYHRVTPNKTAHPRTSVNFRAYGNGVPMDLTSIGVFRNGAFDFRTNQPVKS